MCKHVGIIMDGNRRFAKKLGLNPWKGHNHGEKKLIEVIKWCKEFNIKELTIYAFSAQNFKRPKKEVDHLMKIFKKLPEKVLKKGIAEQGIRFKAIGDLKLFPEDIKKELKKLEQKTKNNKNYYLNVALGYGGREEITNAVKKIATKIKKGTLKIKDINQELIQKNLYLKNEPCFIIRTGGDHRTSNFLPWQSTYSEWFFLNKTWPEIEKNDFEKCINQFLKRERRFGK